MKFRVIRLFDPWKNPLCTCPLKYSLHPYTGCSHFCLYCYATSYIGLKPSTPKKDFLKKLKRDLRFVDRKLFIELSTSSDPYPPVEASIGLTRKTLSILREHGIRTLITTKSNIVIRDIDLLKNMEVAVMITITTLDHSLAKKLEPGAPPPKERLETLKKLSEEEIPVGVRIDPIIPYLNDEPSELIELVDTVIEYGAKHIVTSTYKARPDNFRRLTTVFSDLRNKLYNLYYIQGERIRGYRYLSSNMRKQLLYYVTSRAREKGVTYAVCREGFQDTEYFNAPSCDGSHLIMLKNLSRYKKIIE